MSNMGHHDVSDVAKAAFKETLGEDQCREYRIRLPQEVSPAIQDLLDRLHRGELLPDIEIKLNNNQESDPFETAEVLLAELKVKHKEKATTVVIARIMDDLIEELEHVVYML